MKKFLAICVIFVFILNMTACGEEKETQKNAQNTDETSVITAFLDDLKKALEANAELIAEFQDYEMPEMEDVALTGDQATAQATGEVWTEEVYLNDSWQYSEFSAINSGCSVLYHTGAVPKGIVVGVNAGHGTSGGNNYKTQCHPDGTAKVTGGTTAAGSITAVAVSSGMTFYDGTPESTVTLRQAQILRDKLLANGYDVLMVRDGEDVQLDNVARTVICNNMANCHIALHWDGDGLSYDKGAFYMSVPDGIKYMEPVSYTWEKSDTLGECLIQGLSGNGIALNGSGSMAMDLTQTSYSSVPSIDIELGNAASDHSDARLEQQADGLLAGINMFFGQ